MHGYEIKGHIKRHFGHMWTINDGQLYPNLKSLQEEGLITLVNVSPSDLGGPYKKLYAISPKGRKVFVHWLEHEDVSPMVLRDPFLMRFIFFGFSNKEQAVKIIDHQIKLYEEQCSRRIQHLERWRKRGHYVRLVAELGVELNQMYVKWLKRARQEIIDGRADEARAALMELLLPEEEGEINCETKSAE
jgi:DNA-binding PadR family transcriptional regulator